MCTYGDLDAQLDGESVDVAVRCAGGLPGVGSEISHKGTSAVVNYALSSGTGVSIQKGGTSICTGYVSSTSETGGIGSGIILAGMGSVTGSGLGESIADSGASFDPGVNLYCESKQVESGGSGVQCQSKVVLKYMDSTKVNLLLNFGLSTLWKPGWSVLPVHGRAR